MWDENPRSKQNVGSLVSRGCTEDQLDSKLVDRLRELLKRYASVEFAST